VTPAVGVDFSDPGTIAALVDAAADPGFDRWKAMVAAAGGCREPIHVFGESRMILAGTGEVLSSYNSEVEPGGRLLVACGNRRRTRCPSCSETYRADTYQLIRAGLVGGKNMPTSTSAHPKIFATFTAPSFGAVHHHVVDADDRPQRCHPHGSHGCRRRHAREDTAIGQPLDPASYDYTGAVIWNALSPALWARTTVLVNRTMARLLGIPQRAWASAGKVSVAKVAEYQARGVVHFHAIFRVDGPQPGWPPPAGASVELLDAAIRTAAQRAVVEVSYSDAAGQLGPVCWGEQLDLRPISNGTGGDSTMSDGQVAGYVAKYATKGAEATGTVDHPVCCRDCKGTGRSPDHLTALTCQRCDGNGVRQDIDELHVTPHAKAMFRRCWTLGGVTEFRDLRLRAWAHMLGFRGHFSTKSRRYSTTLGSLRSARRDWRTDQILHARGIGLATTIRRCHLEDLDDQADDEDDSMLVVGHWLYAGRGHSPGQAIFAATIAEDIADNRRIFRQISSDNPWEAAG
jgi:hypothetical protein